MHNPFIQHHDPVAHGHGFHLIMGDINGGCTYSAVKALQFFARRGSELGVEVGKRLVEKKDGGFAHNSPRQSDPLTLTSGELARLTIKKRANTKKRSRPFHLLLVEFPLHLLSLQGEGNIFVHREVRIERVALEDHGDAAVARTEMVDHSSAYEDFAGGRSFQPRDHPQESRFSGA